MVAHNPLIHKDRVVGIFRGFVEGQMEFHADLVLPYRPDYLHRPMHGQFLLVQLAHMRMRPSWGGSRPCARKDDWSPRRGRITACAA
jgi:hypothetical protein